MVIETVGSLTSLSSLSVCKLWNKNDALIFLIDLKIDEQFDLSDLSNDEKEYLNTLKTNYFRKRFIGSRSFLKFILQHILKKESLLDISLYRNNAGRVCVHKHEDIYICISYTGDLAAVSISKLKTGIDIEYIRPIHFGNISKGLLDTGSKRDLLQKDNVNKLKNWTLREAYCKLTDQSMLACLNKEIDLNDIDHQECVIDNRYVLSVAFASINDRINICYLQKGISI
ncbi:4'-phosphopantetheinyl transferase superfamily protein [Methanococcoides sp. AM1]|uniref:4'-phosphopantetheinyl transferase family protein n=1 Tax=Methanococcoides sp. AM1 TaxID=1201011 RepID=UPI0010842489|nr:hypothetical protein [Methanococcoides sp. AM1]